MKKWQWAASLLVGLSCLGGWWQTAQAESNHYSVRAVLPSNQVNKKLTYFDLLVKPGKTQTVTVRINNKDTKSHQYDVTTNLASTSDAGQLVYNQTVKNPDASLQFNLATATSKVKTVTVPAKKAKLVNLKVKLPEKQFPGIALGGINIVQHATADKKSNKQSVSITNQFAYTLGIQLRETKKLTVKPELNLLSAEPLQVNYQNYVVAKLQNSRAVIMHDLKVNSYVTKQGSDKKLLKTVKENMTMAPNSHFNFALGDGSKALAAGNYTLHLKASAENGKYHWQFTKKFTVTQTKAAKAAINETGTNTNWTLVAILGGVIVILIAVIVWILMRNRRKSK